MTSPFDARPIIVAVAGPNGAGKSTFFHAHLASAALRFLNADDLARELEIDAMEAAQLANQLRQSLLEQNAMRVLQGGHDVPAAKLSARFPRTMKRLRAPISQRR